MTKRLLRQLTTICSTIVLAGVILISNAAPATSITTDTELPASLINQLNDIRSANHLPRLMLDPRLVAAAQAKAETLLEEQRFDHRTTDGRTPWDFIHVAGYHYELAAENLAMDYSNPSAITDAWLASPSHKDNMLDPAFTDVGIAIASGDFNDHQTTIVVELFGRPDPVSLIERTVSMIINHRSVAFLTDLLRGGH